MTVVVWDGLTLACDRMAVNGSSRLAVEKMRAEPHRACATTGRLDVGLAVQNWFMGGCGGEWPQAQSGKHWSRLITVYRNDAGFCFVEEYQSLPIAIPIIDPKMAWGSGSDIARGALFMGADSIRAVRAANAISVDCGLGIDWWQPGMPRFLTIEE